MSEIEVKVKEIIVDKLGVDEADVVPEASFTNDLGADSLDTVELIMEFEKTFDITIPDATTIIEKAAFTNCSAMVTAIVGNGVTTIGEDAFANCILLQSIILGENVEYIGKRAFHECNNIVGMICKAQTPPTVEHLKLPEEATVYVPQKMVKTYKKAMGWSNYAKQIKRIKE